MILDDINKRIIAGLKTNGNKTEISTLKMLKAALLTNSKSLNPRKEIDVIKSYLKSLKESRTIFENQLKFDNLEILDIEIRTVESIMPEGVPSHIILNAIVTVIKDMEANGIDTFKQQGRIIGSVKKALPDADGDKIKEILSTLLIGTR